VIITSRNWMPGLAAFHQAQPIQLEPFDDKEVIDFFSQRMSASRVGDDGDTMIRLGRACGGLPLALAIVAARASANPSFPLDLLVREFTLERTPLVSLNAGSAELDLATVFSWSHRGLSEDAARTFELLSAHPGPEISAAAAASMAELDPQRAREVLTELTLASVLRQTRSGRFVFHDLVREYASSLLAGHAPEASARLVNHYVRSARQAILTFGRRPVAPVDDTVPGIIPETFASELDAIRWYTEASSTTSRSWPPPCTRSAWACSWAAGLTTPWLRSPNAPPSPQPFPASPISSRRCWPPGRWPSPLPVAWRNRPARQQGPSCSSGEKGRSASSSSCSCPTATC
jgi:hypothetical protein